MHFTKQRVFIILSILLIVSAGLVNVAKSQISVYSIPYDSDISFTIDDSIPPGEYDLYYYLVASTSNGSVRPLSFTLESNDLLLDAQSYTTAVGFGVSNFKKEAGQAVIANFSHVVNDINASTHAGVGSVYIKNKDTDFEKNIFTPLSWGKEPVFKQEFEKYPSAISEKISISDFADLINFSFDNSNLNLTFLCTRDISEKYEIGLKISTDNVNIIRPSGTTHRIHSLAESEEGWIAGEEYTQSINLNLPPGRYTIDLSILPDAPDTVWGIKIAQLADSKNKIPIGVVDVNGQLLSDYLNRIEENQIIIISVKDEATSSLNDLSLQSLFNLGIQSDLKGKYRWSYLAVISKGLDGFVPYEILSEEAIHADFSEGSLFGSYPLPFNLKLESAGLSAGNNSSIIINDTEYSKNARGMNIVIYNITENKVIESINFDTHARGFRYLP